MCSSDLPFFHVGALNPALCLVHRGGTGIIMRAFDPKQVWDLVESERSIAEQKTREEGKPEQAIAKIVEGRLGGFYKEIVLLEQESVTESKKTVKAVLDAAGTTVTRFARFEVGA